jgi:hypothetical protein
VKLHIGWKMQMLSMNEGYYEYILRRSREEDEKMKTQTLTPAQADMKALTETYYNSINRVKELVYENEQLQNKIVKLEQIIASK